MNKVLCFAIMACLMYACGTPKERVVSVSDVPITGFIKDYVKVEAGDYKFTHNNDDATISIKVKLIKQPNIEYSKDGFASIRLNPVGNDETIFDTGVWGFSAKDDEFAKIEDLLNGSVGDAKTISFKWDYFNQDKAIGKQIFTEAVAFELIDKGFKAGKTTSSLTVSDDKADDTKTDDVKQNDSSKWDKALDEYEKYVDKYIEFYKKAKEGDISAMSEYADMLEKANEACEKLDDAEGDMSAAQIARFTKIQGKLLNAMQ